MSRLPGHRLTLSDGIVEAGEQCDPGSNSTSACCDPSSESGRASSLLAPLTVASV